MRGGVRFGRPMRQWRAVDLSCPPVGVLAGFTRGPSQSSRRRRYSGRSMPPATMPRSRRTIARFPSTNAAPGAATGRHPGWGPWFAVHEEDPSTCSTPPGPHPPPWHGAGHAGPCPHHRPPGARRRPWATPSRRLRARVEQRSCGLPSRCSSDGPKRGSSWRHPSSRIPRTSTPASPVSNYADQALDISFVISSLLRDKVDGLAVDPHGSPWPATPTVAPRCAAGARPGVRGQPCPCLRLPFR